MQNPKDTSEERAVKRASDLYFEAINVCDLPADKAYCCRKYASTIIRDEIIPKADRYQKALEYLQMCIDTYEECLKGFDGTRDPENFVVLVMEQQRACVLLGHVALELKQGEALSKATEKLNALLTIQPNADFKLEALTYTWHLNLSQNKISEARQNVLDSIEHTKANLIKNATDYRHLAKINLLEVANFTDPEARKNYFTRHVLNYLWKSFDAHKNLANPLSIQARNKVLLKDIMILLYAKIVQRLNHIADNNPNETVYMYMERQVLKLYKSIPKQAAFVLNKLREGLVQIKEDSKISLAYNLFDECVVPSISLSSEEFEALFPDFNEFMKTPAPTTIIAPVAQHIGFFYTGERDADEDQSRAASSSPVV